MDEKKLPANLEAVVKMVEALEVENAALRERVGRLANGVIDFAVHRAGCDYMNDYPTCPCGFRAVCEEAKAALEGAEED